MLEEATSAPRLDISPLLSSLSELNSSIKRLPQTQLSIVQTTLRAVFSSFKASLAEASIPEEHLATAKLAAGALKKVLISLDQSYAEANSSREEVGTLMELRTTYRKFIGEFQRVKESNFLGKDVRAALEGQLEQSRRELEELRSREAKESGERESELKQLRQDYTHTLKAGMDADDRVKELSARLKDVEEMRFVFENGLNSMKKALEDEMISKRKLEERLKILEVVADIGIPRMWGSDIRKILIECEQEVGRDPTKQLRTLIDEGPPEPG